MNLNDQRYHYFGKLIKSDFSRSLCSILLGVLIFAGTNFHELFFLYMFEVQFFDFGLLSFSKIAKFAKISNRKN